MFSKLISSLFFAIILRFSLVLQNFAIAIKNCEKIWKLRVAGQFYHKIF